ncbi:MAG: SDR family oxidoreductase [Elusimicrobiota bacterium]
MTPGKKRAVLVTGITGLLGKGFEESYADSYRIVGVHAGDYKVDGARCEHLTLDIRRQDLVEKLFAAHEFDAVIHAAGVANVDYAEKHYAESLESNLVGTLNITAACRRRGIHLTYISTNAVFDGTHPPYGEADEVHPINKYGSIKVDCEKLIRETLEHWTIARPILMYGWNHPVSRQNPATWLIDKLRRGEKVSLVTDVYENPLYYRQCADALDAIIREKPPGVVHLAGEDGVNRYEFGVALANEFSLDAALLSPVDSSFFPSIAPRPKNTTFRTERLRRDLGIKPLTVAQGLALMKKQRA